jgi:hypothetical protein
MELLAILVVLTTAVLVVSWPLRRLGTHANGDWTGELDELRAARDAKYRELRDAELDHRTGKLSDKDFATLDSALRGEVVQILRTLDRAEHGL